MINFDYVISHFIRNDKKLEIKKTYKNLLVGLKYNLDAETSSE